MLRRQIKTEFLPAGAFGPIRAGETRTRSGIFARRFDPRFGAARCTPSGCVARPVAHLDAAGSPVRLAAAAGTCRGSRAPQEPRRVRQEWGGTGDPAKNDNRSSQRKGKIAGANGRCAHEACSSKWKKKPMARRAKRFCYQGSRTRSESRSLADGFPIRTGGRSEVDFEAENGAHGRAPVSR